MTNVRGLTYDHRMPSGPLSPDVMLSIQLSAICSRNQYTKDPAPVIAELITMAGDRTDLLAAEVGRWVGFYDDGEYTHVLAEALREAFAHLDLQPHIELGQQRRNAGTHGTQGYARP